MGTSADAQAGVEEGWDLVCEAGKDAHRGRVRGGVDEMTGEWQAGRDGDVCRNRRAQMLAHQDAIELDVGIGIGIGILKQGAPSEVASVFGTSSPS